MKILNFGSLNIDNVYKVDKFLLPGETKSSLGFSKNCGGKGLNQSIAAAKAGNEVVHAAMLGNDGQMLVDALNDNGVDTTP
ncbi:MAG: ribokinase, partial [Clostridiales bacterium]|nr:ribokinase [Clostridiales bacterium]